MTGLTSFTGEPIMYVLIIEGKLRNGAIKLLLTSKFNLMDSQVMKTSSFKIVGRKNTYLVDHIVCTGVR